MEEGRHFIRGWGYSSDEETRDPGFQVGSYAIPKDLSLKFDHAVLSLKAAGFDIDRSDILETLISLFVHQVDIVEQSADPERGLDLESVLAAAGEGSVVEIAEVSVLKDQRLSAMSSVEKTRENDPKFSNSLANRRDLKDYLSQIDSRFSEIESLLNVLVNRNDRQDTSPEQQPDKKKANQSNESISELKANYESVIEQMMQFVPESEDRQIIENFLQAMKD